MGENSQHDAKRTEGLVVQQCHCMRGGGLLEQHTPFVDHLGPGLQFDEAFRGQIPASSLEAAQGENW